MNKKTNISLVLTTLLACLMAPIGAFGAYTPEGDYYLSKEEIKKCRHCHDNPQALPVVEERTRQLLVWRNADTHHRLYNTKIEKAGAEDSYGCLAPCHAFTQTDRGYEITSERDCSKCHDAPMNWATQHHMKVGPKQYGYGVAVTCLDCHVPLPIDPETGAVRYLGLD